MTHDATEGGRQAASRNENALAAGDSKRAQNSNDATGRQDTSSIPNTPVEVNTIDDLLRRLEAATGLQAKGGGNGQWQCRCPAHEDRVASLSVAEKDGKLLLHCHAGCSAKEVCGALGLTTADLFLSDPKPPRRRRTATRVSDNGDPCDPPTYLYVDPDGKPLHGVVRTGAKRFFQCRPDTTSHTGWRLGVADTVTVIYRLPEVLAAAAEGRTVWITEGEKDADNLSALGLAATCNSAGAGKWKPRYARHLADADVVVLPDNDTPGRKHAEEVAASLHGVASSVRVLLLPDLPPKGDVTDWLEAGGTVTKLEALAADAEVYEPPEVEEAADDEEPAEKKRLTTDLIADALLQDMHFARDCGGRLHVFTDGVYREHGKKQVATAVKRFLVAEDRANEWSSYRANEVAEYIAADAPELWDTPPLDVLNLSNGLLDVKTGELSEHTPSHLSCVQLPVAYDPAARCPAWEKFTSEVFSADTQDLPWQLAAWLMLPYTSIQKAVLLLGEGANGKSIFLSALLTFLGVRNVVGLSLHKLEADRFAVARLVGKLANICADLPSAHLVGTTTFKALTGEDMHLEAEFKHRDGFSFTPYCRLVFSANHPPRSDDASYAFFRRWLCVPFNNSFEGAAARPRKELMAELTAPAELSGLLNMALAHLPGVRRNGIPETASMREAQSEFHAVTDPLSVWLDRETIMDPEAVTPKDKLLLAYNAEAARRGRPTMMNSTFGRALRRLRPDIDDAQRTIAGKRTWVWLGIGLRTDAK